MDRYERIDLEATELAGERLGALPVVNHVAERLGLDALLGDYLPGRDARIKVAPAAVVGALVRNLAVCHRPIYALQEWAAGVDAGLLGLDADEVAVLNDDRVGRTLDRLFDADRASLLTELTVKMIDAFDIDVTQLHNDSTTITVHGDYPAGDGRARGGKPTAKITWGHNKDHRPDLKQLVWILTVSADGAVPLAYRIADGNTNDDVTHIDTWKALTRLVGRTDFLYVADCKLASAAAMGHIHANRGRFVTVLPRGRKQDTFFRDWIVDHTPQWTEVARLPGRRKDDPDQIWCATGSPIRSEQGFRIAWYHNNHKAVRDAAARHGRITRAVAALDELAAKLAGPRCRYTSRVAVERAATTTVAHAGATRWLDIDVAETVDRTPKQTGPGRPGPNTRYVMIEKTRYSLDWHVRDDVIRADAASDGCFPLITNDEELSFAELLAAYRYQPNLEDRFGDLKAPPLDLMPVWLHHPHRIEALACCLYLALLIHALIEREIRSAMATRGLPDLPLYPEQRPCKAPTAPRILAVFSDIARDHLVYDGHVVKTFQPQLTHLQTQILDLLDVPLTRYTAPQPH